MPATKRPYRYQDNKGRQMIKPQPGERGGVEVIPDLERAKQEAEREATLLDQHRYVIQWEEGYVVMSASDLREYFGDWMKDETICEVEAPHRREKWIGE